MIRGVPSLRKTADGGEGVGRADDRSESERRRPAQAGHQGVRHDRDEDHREQHQADRQADERDDVRPQVTDRRFGCGGEEQRRQEDEQHEVGLELDAGKARDESQPEPTEDEQRRIGHADPASDLVDDRDRDEDQQDCGQGLHDWPSIGAFCVFAAGSVWWPQTHAFEVQRCPGSLSPIGIGHRPSDPSICGARSSARFAWRWRRR